MPKLKLTNSGLEKLLISSENKDIEYYDTVVHGLLFRVSNRRGKWYIRATSSVKRKQIKERIGPYPCVSLQEAREIAQKRIREIITGQLAKTDTFLDIAKKWLHSINTSGERSEKYKQDCYRHVQRLKDNSEIANLKIISVKTIHLEEMLLNYRSRPALHNKVRAALCSIMKYAHKHEYIDKLPSLQIPKLIENINDRVFTEAEYHRIIDTAKQHICLSTQFILLVAYTGCRPSDALKAEWSGFDFTNKTWTRKATATKQKQEQTVPISDKVIELLQTIPKTNKYVFPTESTSGHLVEPKKAWKTVCKRAKVKGTLYMLRKFVASQLLRNGVSIGEVQRLMAWSDPKTPLKYYVKYAPQELQHHMNELLIRKDKDSDT